MNRKYNKFTFHILEETSEKTFGRIPSPYDVQTGIELTSNIRKANLCSSAKLSRLVLNLSLNAHPQAKSLEEGLMDMNTWKEAPWK